MKQEIQRVQVGKLVPIHRTVDHSLEMRRDRLLRHELLEDGVPPCVEGDDADVRGVTLVARASMRDVHEPDFHRPSPCVFTTRLSTSAGQYATISSTFGRPPANPVTLGGPLSTSGAISRVNRSTAALSWPRTPNRSCTSGAPR